MKEMIKRKREQGFTLIELMIVIAVIGILAIVLVPKFGNIKTSAKDTGVTTNFRSVTAAVHSVKFNKDDDDDDAVADKVLAQLKKDFTGNNVLVNPYTKSEDIVDTILANGAVIVGDDTLITSAPSTTTGKNDYVGAIVVVGSVTTTGIQTVTVYGCDEEGKLIDGLTEIIEP